MVFTETFFDRYLLPIVPRTILFLLHINSKINEHILAGFVLFLGILSTKMAADFILKNNYIWRKSSTLVEKGDAKPNEIAATHAWKKLNGTSDNIKYIFSYDSPNTNPEISSRYEMLEVQSIEYPLNWFVNTKIYLYKKTKN